MEIKSELSEMFKAAKTDEDMDTLQRLAAAADLLWRCSFNECNYYNPKKAKRCEACGTQKPTPVDPTHE